MRQYQISDTPLPVHHMNWIKRGGTHAFTMHTFHPENLAAQAHYPHRHSFYQVLVVTAGQGNHVVDFETMPIRAPAIFFVAPGQVHFWQVEKPLQGYGLLFGSDFLALNSTEIAGVDPLILFHSMRHSSLHLRPEQLVLLEKQILLLAQEYKRREFNYVSIVRAYLHILFSTIQRLYTAIESDRSINSSAEFVQHFRRLVSSYYGDQRSLQFYADQLGISASYLSEQVKTATGFTAAQVIRQEVILEAKRLLINTDLTVEEISYKLKFSDPAYFGRFFKRETSTSPGRYRQDIRKKYQNCQV